MITDDTIRDAKRQYNINRWAAKILTLSFGKFYMYEYLLGEEISPSNWSQTIKQAKFMNSPIKIFGKTDKINLSSRRKTNKIKKEI